MQVQSDDITVLWGQAPPPQDAQFGRWRLAVFQDVQESLDRSKLYFLYDPVADENAVTSHGRKGGPSLVVFDVNLRCFVAEIPLHVQGSVKFLFALKCPSSLGGTAFTLVCESDDYGSHQLHMWRLDMPVDGLNPPQTRSILPTPLHVGGEYIVSMREDAPEIVVLANPGLQVYRVNCLVEQPTPPTTTFSVPGADLSHFYDGFLSMGNVYLLSSSPDGHLDYTRVHVLSLMNTGQITTHNCQPDVNRGFPPARKQAAIDSISGWILLAGGEIDYGNSVTRLVDYWVLDLKDFRWTQIPAQMPVPLIEPRLTASNSGNVYLWGDFDQPLPGMPSDGTHIRIIKVTGLGSMGAPPSYQQAMSQPPASSQLSQSSQAAPPQPSYGYQQQTPYPPAFGGTAVPTYPYYNPSSQNPGYNAASPAYPQQYPSNSYPGIPYPQSPPASSPSPYPQDNVTNVGTRGQYAFYPPQQKKDCSIM